MAKRTFVQYIDDYDGKEIAEEDVRKISISFNGTDFALEVSAANEEKIAAKINPILAKARRVGGRRRPTSGKR